MPYGAVNSSALAIKNIGVICVGGDNNGRSAYLLKCVDDYGKELSDKSHWRWSTLPSMLQERKKAWNSISQGSGLCCWIYKCR